ncbi:dTDP-4-dehydrorhamnose reductase [Gordonia sp. CPCC 206044]|uniref:dTDP-4-dehydrorhamnose reductase n=1 Tax=Gordonia sp. CPCC 206044 TaxID=3140793 RepID=UPI003AF3712B
MTATTYIVGAAGQLGTALQNSPHAPSQVRALTSADLDITDQASVADALAALGPRDVVINCAAYTNVDGAQSDVDSAVAVNRDGPRHLARATAAVGARLVHVSTDYVFAGAAATSDRPGRTVPYEPDDVSGEPETVYGASKLAGERAVSGADPRATIVRTAWVYTGGPESPDFVGTMRRLEADRDEVTVVDDQTGSPTYAPDLADALWELAADGRDTTRGVVLHATNAGGVTWYQVARAVFDEIGADPSRVRPCTTADFPRPAPRPAFSVLSGSSWTAAGLAPLRDWRAALHDAIHQPRDTRG